MAELINVNTARKARDHAAGKAKAAENRTRHGQTKGQKAVTKLETERARRELDGAKRED